MSKQTINLCQVVDYMLDSAGQNYQLGFSEGTYYPSRTADLWDKWWVDFTFPQNFYITPTGTYDKYPVSDYYTDKEGTTYISMVVSGFSKEEISVERDGDKLVISGNRSQEKKDKEKDFKYVRHDISKKSFKEPFKGSDKWDWEKIKVSLSEGILTVAIPLKEEAKPIKKVFDIE